jgi:hypothetical protein
MISPVIAASVIQGACRSASPIGMSRQAYQAMRLRARNTVTPMVAGTAVRGCGSRCGIVAFLSVSGYPIATWRVQAWAPAWTASQGLPSGGV